MEISPRTTFLVYSIDSKILYVFFLCYYFYTPSYDHGQNPSQGKIKQVKRQTVMTKVH